MRLIPPLRHRAVALLWGGLAFSAVGDRAYDVAFAWIAAEVFGANAGFLVALGPLATQRAGLPLASYGLVIPAYGCTNLIANLIVGSRPMTERPGGQIFAGNVCLGLGILALGGAATLPAGWLMPAAMAASGLAAVGGPMQDIAVAVLCQPALARGDAPAATRAFMASSQGGALVALVLAPALIAALPMPGVIGLVGLRRFG